MGAQDWRVALALLGASGWGWNLTLEKLSAMRANPGLYPASLWITLILIDIVLLLIDVWAIMALIKAIWPGDQSESDDEQRTVGEQGTAR